MIIFSSAGEGMGQGAAPKNFFAGAIVGPLKEGEPQGGSWLRVDSSHEIPVDTDGGIDVDALNKRQIFYAVGMSLAYKDIFGHQWWLFDCYMYDASVDGNIRQCPISARIPPKDYEQIGQPPKRPWWKFWW